MYQEQRLQSDKYLESFKKILKENSMHFLSMEISNNEKDMQEATDMIIKITGGDIALRVREPNCKFRDFTVRSQTRYGNKTEIDKLKEGFGDWYLYGWGDGNSKVNEHILVDIHKLRETKLLEKNRRHIPNGDGTKFISITIDELEQSKCIISKNIKNKKTKTHWEEQLELLEVKAPWED